MIYMLLFNKILKLFNTCDTSSIQMLAFPWRRHAQGSSPYTPHDSTSHTSTFVSRQNCWMHRMGPLNVSLKGMGQWCALMRSPSHVSSPREQTSHLGYCSFQCNRLWPKLCWTLAEPKRLGHCQWQIGTNWKALEQKLKYFFEVLSHLVITALNNII